MNPTESHEVDREQFRVLRQLEAWAETPMFILGLLWVALTALELAGRGGPSLERAVTVIWIIFLAEFAVKFIIAPRKVTYLRSNWLTVFALALPALRVFRVARVVRLLRAGRAVRGLTLARVLTSFNRGLRSLQRAMGRYGFGYVAVLSLLVTILGAAGMFYFERGVGGTNGLQSFGDALWFTGMLMTTSGSDYWPQTPEGRILCFLLALFAFAIFGYVTATIASLLVGQEVRAKPSLAEDARLMRELRSEINSLREQLTRLGDRHPVSDDG